MGRSSDESERKIDNFKETNRGPGTGRDTVPNTGTRGQEERDASAVRVANLHSPRQR